MLAAREDLFREHDIDSVEQLRTLHAAGRLPQLASAEIVLIIDGFGALRDDFEELDDAVVDILKRGGGYGIHVVAGMLRWNDVRIAIQSNFGTRVELRLNDPSESSIDRKLAADPVARRARPHPHRRQALRAGRPPPHGRAPPTPRTWAPSWSARPVRSAPPGAAKSPSRYGCCRTSWNRICCPDRSPSPAGARSAWTRRRWPPSCSTCSPRPAPAGHGRQRVRQDEPAEDDRRRAHRALRRGRRWSSPSWAAARPARRDPRGVQRRLRVQRQVCAGLAAGIATELEKRLPDDSAGTEDLEPGSWGSGPRIVVLVDDYDVLTTAGQSPLALPAVHPLARSTSASTSS